MDAAEAWNSCLAIIRENVTPRAYADWFQQIEAVSLADHILTIRVPSVLYCEHLDEHYSKLLKAVLRIVFKGVFTQEVKLQYYYGRHDAPHGSGQAAYPTEAPPLLDPFVLPGVRQIKITPNLNPHYTFENFVPGPSNLTAYQTGKALVTKRGAKSAYNPLFISGSQGLGKTHLAHAIGLAILQQSPETKVVYVTGNEFRNQFINATRHNQVPGFIGFYQSVDVIIFDDIHEIANGKGAQEILNKIFDYLHSRGKQLIFTSAVRISELKHIHDDLISRLRWGMIADVQMPDEAMRLTILRQKARLEDIQGIPEEVYQYIAKQVTTDVRELMGGLLTLMGHATAMRCPIDLPFAREILKDFITGQAKKEELTVRRVVEVVADHFALTPDELRSKTRKREIAEARQIAMYMAKKYTRAPYAAIGQELNRNHATVIHACKTIDDLAQSDNRVRIALAELDTQLQLLA